MEFSGLVASVSILLASGFFLSANEERRWTKLRKRLIILGIVFSINTLFWFIRLIVLAVENW